MSERDDDPRLVCDWCINYPNSLPGDALSVPTASVAVAVTDCCTDTCLDYLLCEQHWLMLRDQPFPGACPHCGAVADTLDDIVTTAMSMSGDDELLVRRDTVSVPAPSAGTATLGLVPTAIRQSFTTEHATTSAPDDAPVSGPPTEEPLPRSGPLWTDDYDYATMAEQMWSTGRQQVIAEDYQYASEDIAQAAHRVVSARTSGDAMRAAQLENTVSALTYQRDHAAYVADDAFKRDWYAYAMWRQTEHGQYFRQWCQRTLTMTTWTAALHEAWTAAWNTALDTITPAERTAHRTRQWIARPRRHHLLRWTRDTAVVLAVAGVVAALILGPAWWALPVAALAAAGYAAWSTRDSVWTEANDRAGRAAHDQRVALFGFDPLDEPDRPAPDFARTPTDELLTYTAELQQFAISGFETHPAPDALPEPHWPVLIDPDTLPLNELRAVLRGFVQ